MKGYKGREVQLGIPVDVYRNLNTGNYSVRCNKTKRVLAHFETVRLQHGVFKVSQSGREKTIQEKRRRVHAWVSGILAGFNEPQPPDLQDIVYYNPYVTSYFIHGDQVITEAEEVFFQGKFCFIRANHSAKLYTLF